MKALAIVVLLLSLQERSEGRVPESIDGHRQKSETGFHGDFDDLRMAAQADYDRPLMAKASKLTQSEKDAIVEWHNKERAKTGGNDMLAMTWDEDLARLAQGLSDTCKWEHANLKLPGGERVGQNLAMNPRRNYAIDGLVQLWIDEKEHYDIRSGTCETGKVCGHYTQVVWSKTDKVGCGKTSCSIGTILVCDYSPAGNTLDDKPVNLGGAPCSRCNFKPGSRCNAGLCEACNSPGQDDCRAYDASKCVDAKKDGNIKRLGCDWALIHCSDINLRWWMEKNCAKSCGYC